MENFENSHSNLIYLFLDREATPLEQEILFKALSENSELRAEFENALEVYSGFKSDKSNLNPPVHLATSIFSTAGMTYPNGYNASNTIPKNNIFSKLNNILKPALFLFVGSLLTYFSVLLFNSQEQNDINGLNRAILTGPNIEQTQNNLLQSYFNNNNSKDNITAISNIANSNQSAKPIIQSYEKEETSKALALPVTDFSTKIDYSQLNNSKNNSLALKLSDDLNPKTSLINSSFGINNPLFSIEPVRNPEFYLELRGNTNLNQFPVNSQTFSFNKIYENLGLGIYYKLGHNNLIGAFVGNEPFNIFRVNDPEYITDFTPISNIMTFGATYRQLLPVFELNGYLTPFVDIATGISEYGVITKGAMGVNLNPNNLINFVVGLDGTMLFYKFKGNVQTTEKIAVFFNIGFNL